MNVLSTRPPVSNSASCSPLNNRIARKLYIKFMNNAVVPKEVTLNLSPAEATKIWMEMQDPTIAEGWIDPEGNAFSEDMLAHVEETMGTQGKVWGQAQLDLYLHPAPLLHLVAR